MQVTEDFSFRAIRESLQAMKRGPGQHRTASGLVRKLACMCVQVFSLGDTPTTEEVKALAAKASTP